MTRRSSRSRPRCARAGFTWVELLVVLVLIVVGISLFLPSRTICGESANRVKCASNLRQIGQAILLYSNDNRGAYPRTRMSAGPIRKPVWGTGAPATQPWDKNGPAENDVTAALFMLLRTEDITSDVFVCPVQGNNPPDYARDEFDGKQAKDRSNFTDWRKNLSYSYENPYPSDDAVKRGFHLDNTIGAEFAVASDMNPGIAGKGQNVLAVTPTSSAQQMKQANSPNHDGDGQNILYGDGHVSWESNPFVGVNRDNIYTRAKDDGSDKANPSDASDPFGSPYDANDSVLLPTDD
jgi:prepilin-type processing-associated H-X9-DG protein